MHAGHLVTGRIKTGKLRGPERLVYIRTHLAKVLDAAKPTLVALEGYAMGGLRGNNTFNIGEMGGVIKTLLYERGVPYFEVPPTVLKSVIALHGKAEKHQMVDALRTRFGFDVPQHDEADAAALMVVGEMRTGVRPATPKSGKSDRFEAVREAQIVQGAPQTKPRSL